jgi:penicillin-binding protein 2
VVVPHLVQRVINKDTAETFENRNPENLGLKKQNVDNVIAAMTNVIHSSRGTAGSLARGINYHIAGKTGTAQVFTIKQEEKYNEDAIDFKMRDHALFIALAPVEDPQIAVAVIAEHGGHGGTVAAPIAGEIIRAYLNQNKASANEK